MMIFKCLRLNVCEGRLWKTQLMFEKLDGHAHAHLETRKRNLNSSEIGNLESKIQVTSL